MLLVQSGSSVELIKRFKQENTKTEFDFFTGQVRFKLKDSDKGEAGRITVLNKDQRLLVRSGDSILFDRHRMKATVLSITEKNVTLGLYDSLAKGASFYGFLVCRKTPSGILSSVLNANPFLEILECPKFSYYILDPVKGAKYPKQWAICNVWLANENQMKKYVVEFDLSGTIRLGNQ